MVNVLGVRPGYDLVHQLSKVGIPSSAPVISSTDGSSPTNRRMCCLACVSVSLTVKLLFCSFYTSTSSTTNVRADSAILDTSYKLWGHKTTAQAEILQYHYHTSIRRVDNAIPCHRTYCIRPARHAQPMRRRKIERNEEKRNGRKKTKKGP